MKILIAEDDPVSRILITSILRKLGHEVLQTTDGEKAWEVLSREKIPVLITDWMMPGIDGPELCRRLREREASRYTYVILLSARDNRESFLEGMEAGADDYLTKPLDAETLAARLRVAERILGLQREVHQLKSLLPICSYCRRIRHDDDTWSSLEQYVGQHTMLSHGLCPECYGEQAPPRLDR